MDDFLPAASILARYSICAMTLSRWLKDQSLTFPQPIVIKRRRYFRREEILNWERKRIRRAPIKQPTPAEVTAHYCLEYES